METPTDRSDGYRKVNSNSTSDQIERENSGSIQTDLSSQRQQVGAINRQNKNSGSGIDRGGDNYNVEYLVPIKTRLGNIIVKPYCF